MVILLDSAGLGLGPRARGEAIIYQDEVSAFLWESKGLDGSLSWASTGAAKAPDQPDRVIPHEDFKVDLLSPSGTLDSPSTRSGSTSQVQCVGQPVTGSVSQPLASIVLPRAWEDEYAPDSFLETVFRPPRSHDEPEAAGKIRLAVPKRQM